MPTAFLVLSLAIFCMLLGHWRDTSSRNLSHVHPTEIDARAGAHIAKAPLLAHPELAPRPKGRIIGRLWLGIARLLQGSISVALLVHLGGGRSCRTVRNRVATKGPHSEESGAGGENLDNNGKKEVKHDKEYGLCMVFYVRRCERRFFFCLPAQLPSG